MKNRVIYVLLLAIIQRVMAFGADSTSLAIHGLPPVITAQEDELVAIAFDLRIGNCESAGWRIRNYELKLEGVGAIAVMSNTNDPDSVIAALYYLTIPYGAHPCTILAILGSDTTAADFTVIGLPTPTKLTARASPDTISIHFGQPATAQLSAKVLDKRDLGCPAKITMKVREGNATLPRSAVTDSAGRVAVPLKLNGKWIGTLSVELGIRNYELRITKNIPVRLAAPVRMVFIDDENQESRVKNQEEVARNEERVASNSDSPPITRHSLLATRNFLLILDTATPSLSLRVLVSESGGNPISNVKLTVEADPNLLNAPPEVITDAKGIAILNLTPTGKTGRTKVQVTIPALDLTASREIEISSESKNDEH